MPTRSFRAACAGLLLLAVIATPARAQTGRIAGRVIDTGTGRPIAGARVAVIISPARSAVTAVDGTYQIRNVPAGAHSVAASHLGHATKTVTGVQVGAGAAVSLDISLAPQALAMEGITVSAARERGSVNRALDEQRTATGITSTTTSEQIARSPDSDAAQAVQRVSGVTVQEGKFVFVRGLGERYTTTSLNGARIPSPEPERRVVPLDLFPSSLLEAITTSKTFTPDQPGDFSGAQVNLRTRTFPARRTFNASLATGYTTGVGGGTPGVPGAGSDWLGFPSANRDLPGIARSAGSFDNLTQGDVNLIARSFRNEWSPTESDLPPNLSGSVSLGGQDPLLGQRIGYAGALTYSRSQDVRDGEIRSRAVPDADGNAVAQNTFTGRTGTRGVLWGGMLNLSTLFGGSAHKIELNNSYNRASEYEAREDLGTLEEFQQLASVTRSSLQFVERSVRSSQLRGEHALGRRMNADWSLAASGVTRDEPDRSDLLYGREIDVATGAPMTSAWLGFIPGGARRTFSTLGEDAYDGGLNLAIGVGPSAREGRVKIGASMRRTERDADSRSYNLRSLRLSHAQRAVAPEELFDGRYMQNADSLLTVEKNLFGGEYHARDDVAAGYAMGEWLFADRVKVIAGARVERWQLGMDDLPADGTVTRIERTNTDILPSLAVNVALTDVQSLRFSATQTLARPEYRELSASTRATETGEQLVFGNPQLVRTQVRNFDARWEWYPNSGEVLSFGVFGKQFQNPIERIDVASSGATQLSFANAASAVNYGVELEARKGLGTILPALEAFSANLNASLVRSEIRLGEGLSAATNPDRAMVGQAPYVINAGLSYAGGSDGRTAATLLYNVVGPRIVSAAVTPLRVDSEELARHVLDLSVRFPLVRGMSAKIDAENLLDSAVEVRQGEVTRLRYNTGRTVAVGVTWRR